MKVAIVQEHLNIQRGGAETSTCEMALHLAGLNLEVALVCADDRQRSYPDQKPALAETVTIHRLEAGDGSKLTRTIQFMAEADRFCRQTGFDIVHAITPCFSCDVYQPRGGTYVETVKRSVERVPAPLRWIKRLGRRFNRRQRFLLLAEHRLLGGPNPPHVVAISQYVARQVREAYPAFPPQQIHAVFNGVDVEPVNAETRARRRESIRCELGIAVDAAVVLFVAHNFKLKGHARIDRGVRSRPARCCPDICRRSARIGCGRARSAPGLRTACRPVGNRFRGALP